MYKKIIIDYYLLITNLLYMKNLFKISALTLAVLPVMAFAQTTFGSILTTSGNLLSLIIKLLFAAALAFFVFGVIKFVIAGDADKKAEARHAMIQGIIGLFVIVSVWGLVGVIQSTFGIGAGGTIGGSQIPEVDFYQN